MESFLFLLGFSHHISMTIVGPYTHFWVNLCGQRDLVDLSTSQTTVGIRFLIYFSVTEVKHWIKATWRWKGVFSLQITLYGWGKSRQESRSHEGMLLTGLLNYFSYTAQAHFFMDHITHKILDPPTWVSFKMPPWTCLPTKVMKVIPQLRYGFLFQRVSSLC